jgi:hypothetical protein
MHSISGLDVNVEEEKMIMPNSKRHIIRHSAGIIGLGCLSISLGIVSAWAEKPGDSMSQQTESSAKKGTDEGQKYTLLPTHWVITGTVEEVDADHAKVNSGDTGEMSPRYLSLERAREKGFSVKKGDTLEIVVNAKNHVVDYHLKNGAIESHHRIIKGKLAQPLKVGQEQAIITTEEGKTESYPVRPLARSEVAAIPIDQEGWFLLDETNKIASATLPHDIVAEYDWARSSAYNVYRHVNGTIQEVPDQQTITIQTQDDETVSLPVWDYLKDEMSQISKGKEVNLLVDSEEKVVDIAVPEEVK